MKMEKKMKMKVEMKTKMKINMKIEIEMKMMINMKITDYLPTTQEEEDNVRHRTGIRSARREAGETALRIDSLPVPVRMTHGGGS